MNGKILNKKIHKLKKNLLHTNFSFSLIPVVSMNFISHFIFSGNLVLKVFDSHGMIFCPILYYIMISSINHY